MISKIFRAGLQSKRSQTIFCIFLQNSYKNYLNTWDKHVDHILYATFLANTFMEEVFSLPTSDLQYFKYFPSPAHLSQINAIILQYAT